MNELSDYIPSIEEIQKRASEYEREKGAFHSDGIQGPHFIQPPHGVETSKENVLRHTVEELVASYTQAINEQIDLAFADHNLLRSGGRYTVIETNHGDSHKFEMTVTVSGERMMSHSSKSVNYRYFYFQQFLSLPQRIAILSKVLEYYANAGWKTYGPDEDGSVSLTVYPFRNENPS